MKKLLALVAIAGTVSFLACGPSAEELEKVKKMREDSIRIADSTASAAAAAEMQRIADSTKMADDAKRIADSTRVADSLAAKKGKK